MPYRTITNTTEVHHDLCLNNSSWSIVDLRPKKKIGLREPTTSRCGLPKVSHLLIAVVYEREYNY